jgi:hypothetical protein
MVSTALGIAKAAMDAAQLALSGAQAGLEGAINATKSGFVLLNGLLNGLNSFLMIHSLFFKFDIK